MGLRIGSSPSRTTLFAQRQLTLHRQRAAQARQRLASGRRIDRAGGDPAGLAISERLQARIRSVQQVRRNGYDGLSTVQIAEGALGETSGLLIRVRRLAVQSANGTLDVAQRRAIGEEAEALLREVDRIATTTRFGDRSLLDGASPIEIAADADAGDPLELPGVDARRSALGLEDVNLGSDAETAAAAFSRLDAAIEQVAADRGRLGTSANVLESRIRQGLTEEEALRAAHSRVVDADFAAETAGLAKAQLLEQATVGVLVEARRQDELVLELLESGREAAEV